LTKRNQPHRRFVDFSHGLREEFAMRQLEKRLSRQKGKIGWILLWLLGVPIPVLLVLFLLRGCT